MLVLHKDNPKVCCGDQTELLRPKLSHIDFTCQVYVDGVSPVKLILEVFTVSYEHEPPWGLYLTLYPQVLETSSQSKSIEEEVALHELGLLVLHKVLMYTLPMLDYAETVTITCTCCSNLPLICRCLS